MCRLTAIRPQTAQSLKLELRRQLKDNDSPAYRLPILRDFIAVRGEGDAETPDPASPSLAIVAVVEETDDQKGAVGEVKTREPPMGALRAAEIAAAHQRWSHDHLATLRGGMATRSAKAPRGPPVPEIPPHLAAAGRPLRPLGEGEDEGLRLFDDEDNGILNPMLVVSEIAGGMGGALSKVLSLPQLQRGGAGTIRYGDGGEFLAV